MGEGVVQAVRAGTARRRWNVPRVSVTMLARNADRWIAQAIESILDQTLTAWELIVIDDGSTDGTATVAEWYARRDRRIRVVSREARGIPRSRNEALRLSRGQYIAIQDADDTCTRDRLQRQAAYLDAHPECVWVSCRMLMVDAQGSPIRQINIENTHEQIDAVNMGGRGFFVNSAYTARREAMLAVGGFREQLPVVEDCDMTLRLAERWRVAALDEVLYHYRRHWASSTQSDQKLVEACIRQVVTDACLRRGLPAPREPMREEAAVSDSSQMMIAQGAGETQRIWAWWSLKDGHVKTARKYAFAALMREPLSPESWKAAVCALRGR